MSATDKPLNEGTLYMKQNKFGKKWKRCYALLYPDSPFGVARLEFYDWKDGTVAGDKMHTRRTADRKIVRLAQCVCVVSAPSETGPKENMAAFTLETSEKTILLSAERTLATEWIQRLCEVAFPNKLTGSRSSQDKEPPESPDVASLEMAVNSIYISREEACEFYVTVQRTEAAERCALRGTYILRTERDCLILKEQTSKEPLYSWPYKLLRRYGRDKVMFSFEAGRRCSSGPGNFTFETSQGHEIFQRVEFSIKAQQEPEQRLSCPTLDTDCATDVSLVPEFVAPEVKDAAVRKEPEDKSLKCRTLPNVPLTKPTPSPHLLDPGTHALKPASSGTPPRSPVSHTPCHNSEGDIEHIVGVYSEPKDSVKGTKPHFDPLYSDPVDCVAGKEGKGQKSHTDRGVSPLYSDLYEQVAYEVVGGEASQKLQRNPNSIQSSEEHIYDEPEGIAKPTESLQLYSEVRMEGGAWKRQANDKLGYEYPYNPNTDDYSVPNPQMQRNQQRPKAAGPKPVPAPKPQGKMIPKPPMKEENCETSGHMPFTASNSNNNNSHVEAVYSKIQKPAGVSQHPPAAKPLSSTSPALPRLPLGPKSIPVPVKPLPSKPLTLPTLPYKPLAAPALPLPPKPPAVAPSVLSQGVPQLSPPSVSLEEELSVDCNNVASVYEDMGMV